MHFRMGEYRCMLHQMYDHPVKQYVIYMGKARLTTPNHIDLPGLRFEYTLISISELSYKLFLSSDEPEEQILSVLANFGNKDPTRVIKTILEKLRKTSLGELSDNKYYQQLRILIQMRNLDKQINKAMLEVKTFWKKERDVLYKWGQEDGIQKGIQKGIQTGEAKGRHEEALGIAKNFKDLGVSITDIAKGTGLSIEEIEQL